MQLTRWSSWSIEMMTFTGLCHNVVVVSILGLEFERLRLEHFFHDQLMTSTCFFFLLFEHEERRHERCGSATLGILNEVQGWVHWEMAGRRQQHLARSCGRDR